MKREMTLTDKETVKGFEVQKLNIVGLKIESATTFCGNSGFKLLSVNKFARKYGEKLALPFASVKCNFSANRFELSSILALLTWLS